MQNIIVDNGVCKAGAKASIKEVSDEEYIIHVGLASLLQVHAALWCKDGLFSLH